MYNNNYNSSNGQNSNGQNGGKRGISWLLIAALFALGLWYIALPLLLIKLFAPTTGEKKQSPSAPSLSEAEARRQAEERIHKEEKEQQKKETINGIKSLFDSPKEGKGQSIALTALGSVIMFLSLSMIAANATEMAIGFLLFLISTFIAGGALFISGRQMSSAMNRYTRYAGLIGANDAYEIASLASKTGYSEKRVERDLQKMIEKGYFGKKAYINQELGYFFMSSEADEEFMEAKKSAYEKTADAARKEAAKQTANVYEQFLYQISDVNERIPGEKMSSKIYQIEDITRKIFLEVEKEPKKRAKIDRFMTYYLPTTLKLLEHYAKLNSTKVDGENIVKSKESIENAMDSIVEGFERQLDELYKTDNLDIETDIDVLVQMLERDKAKEDFKPKEQKEADAPKEVSLGGTAAQTK